MFGTSKTMDIYPKRRCVCQGGVFVCVYAYYK